MSAILEPVSSLREPESGFFLGADSSAFKGSKFDQQIESRARAALQSHPHFKGNGELVQCHCSNQCLQLSGVLPSFYLKQLAQAALKEVCQPCSIENRIMVVFPEDEIRV